MWNVIHGISRYLNHDQKLFLLGLMVTIIVYDYSLIPAELNAFLLLGLLVRTLSEKSFSLIRKGFTVMIALFMIAIYVDPRSIDMVEGKLRPYTPEGPELFRSTLRLRHKLQEVCAYRWGLWGRQNFEERMEFRRDLYPFFEEDPEVAKSMVPHPSASLEASIQSRQR